MKCVLLGFVQPYVGFYSIGFYFLVGAYSSSGCWGVFCWVLYNLLPGFIILGCDVLLMFVALMVVRVWFVGLCIA